MSFIAVHIWWLHQRAARPHAHRPPQGSQETCQTTHAADTRSASEYLPHHMLPGNGPRTRHANELQCSACRLRSAQPRIRVIAFAMNTSAYQVLWFNASCNQSRGDCKTLLDHKLFHLTIIFGYPNTTLSTVLVDHLRQQDL